jgi:hypothetical protein
MSNLTATPPLTAALTNADHSNNIYITTDATLNHITIKLTNNTNTTISLPAGKPVRFDQRPAGASAVYLDFKALLSNDEIQHIVPSAPGWSADTFADDKSQRRYLVIAPDAAVELSAGASLDFKLENVLASESPTSRTGTLAVLGAAGIPAHENVASLYVNVAEPPKPGEQDLTSAVLDIGFTDPNVYTGDDAALVLQLTNLGSEPLVRADDKWPAKPSFRLTLLHGDSVGDLTTVTDANSIIGNLGDVYGNTWKQVERDPDGEGWILQPQPDANGGGAILGSDARATTEFSFAPIHATLPAGVDDAITVAHVSWSGIPGYKAGSRGVKITKHHGPAVTCSAHDPGDKTRPSVFGPQDATLTTVLEWQADYADHVTFDVADPRIGKSEHFDPCNSGPLPGGITAQRDQPLRVTAHKDKPAGTATATVSLTLATVSRNDVPLPVAGPATFITPPGRDTGYLFWLDTPRFATVDLRTRTVGAPQDVLPGLQPNPWTRTGIRDAASSPDGTTLYLFAEVGSRLAVLGFDAVKNETVKPPDGIWTLRDAPTKDSRYETTMISALHDGKWVLIWSGGDESSACWLIGAADLHWTGTTLHTWDQYGPDRGAVVAVNADASRVFSLTETALTMFNTEPEHERVWGGRYLPATLELKNDHGLVPLTPGRLTADARRMYFPALDEKTTDRQAGTVSAVLCVVDVSGAAWGTQMKPPPNALSLATTVPLGTMPAASIAGRSVPVWTENWTALSADEKTVYVGVWPDIATVATATGTVQRWPVALTSPRLAVHDGIVCCTPRGDGAGVLSFITLTPEARST